MLIRTIIELLGFPQKHVDKTINLILEKLQKEKDITIIKHKLAEPQQQKKMWSAFIDAELKIKDLETFFEFCFNYLPTSIEIVEAPKFKIEELNKSLNEMLNYMHRYHQAISQLNAQNEILKTKLNEKS